VYDEIKAVESLKIDVEDTGGPCVTKSLCHFGYRAEPRERAESVSVDIRVILERRSQESNQKQGLKVIH
jgi:hypothetical protein